MGSDVLVIPLGEIAGGVPMRACTITLISLSVFLSFLLSCSGKKEARYGDAVKVHYTGKLEDGTVFDASEEGKPLEFTVGSGEVIPGFEMAVIGMKPGDKRTITLAPEEAYGQSRPELIGTVPRMSLAEGVKPVAGQQLKMKRPDGGVYDVVVVEVTDDSVTLDANHPLAGKTLIFDLELVGIE